MAGSDKTFYIIYILLIISFILFYKSVVKASTEDIKYKCRDLPVLFQKSNYSGQYLQLPKSIGSLNEADFGSKASSLCVPEGWELKVYKDEGYCASNYHIKGPISYPDLKNLSPGITNWNDSINSVKVISPDSHQNLTKAPFGELTVKWAGVVDNAEGPGFPHGPYGNLHILIYDTNNGCPDKQKIYPSPLRHIVLPGPSPTGKKCEWDDGDQTELDSLGLFEWRSEEDKIVVFIYESDGKSHGKDWVHDPVFCQTIGRKETLSAVVFESPLKAGDHAIERAKQRNAEKWVERVLPDVKNGRIGMMFLELETLPRASTYNDRSK